MSSKSKIGVEIEKKYIIMKPVLSDISRMDGYFSAEILQIYLPSQDGATHRVRRSRVGDTVIFTETKKIRIDKMSATEIEGEISEERFLELSSTPKAHTRPIEKIRHTFCYLGQRFEIDIYPEWKHTAIMETELESRETNVVFPKFIKIVRDVTGEKPYSNASMSVEFPSEECPL